MEVPALQVYYRVFHWNREPAAQEPSDSKSLKLSSKTGNLKFPVFFNLGGCDSRCVIIIAIDIAIDINVHAIENHIQNLARTFVTPLGDFYMFFCVMGLGADTICINNATHPSRPG